MLKGTAKTGRFVTLDTVMYIVHVCLCFGWPILRFGHTPYYRTHAREPYGRVSTTFRRAW
jgi:hypothetical protein